ncbi:glycoside hydrolase family 3 N-terminal domain-containing protein [Hungatella hathewayi]|uniref:glycoside hydrolase family 3 C-terminal domain-containing protein n=1 Tax=Hungatella hathewayi TaxID=154046 RepID=UPI0003383C6E|nr:glycoside hydrolase family 3 N-terminal domain-containing protein [Hungatella hathewayi]CCZ63002.1 glycoside hydrolase family 3 domain-containing protein [Hungatella hathewayi CAG:224]
MRNRENAEKKAKELVAQMTLFEKASQLSYESPAIKRLGVPAYNWWNEALHGVARAGTATVFPQAIGLAAMFDEEELERIAEVIAEEGRAKYNQFIKEDDRGLHKGITFWSPNVNIFRDPRWGRGHETYGEDPYLTSRLGVAYVKGLQGDGEVMKAAACAKHYAVHSGPESLRHEFDAEVSKKDLWETYLPAFEALVREAEVESVMGAYNRTNGEPCCGSRTLLKDILRDTWGFKGHVVSDCWAIKDFHENHRVTDNMKESAAMALNAGCDLNCGCTYLYLMSAYEDGLVTEEQITEAAERLFTTRYLLGIMDGSPYDSIPYDVVESREHIELALDAAAKSAVLLKNDGILPLKKETGTIGVIGPNADSRICLYGNYYGISSEYITVLEGIRAVAGEKTRILYSEGCGICTHSRTNLFSEAAAVARLSDVVILCLGLDERLEGEEHDISNQIGSGDKEGLGLPDVQQELMELVVSVGKPVVLVLMAGSAIDLRYAREHVNGILDAWYPGARGGKAVADLLFGKVSPSGKLPVTFYADLEGMPEFTDYSMKNRTYRYLEREALYPFGYGLTYGKGRVTGARIVSPYGGGADSLPETGTADHGLLLEAETVNSSNTPIEEVLQIYIKDLESPHAVRNYSLCGFKRVSLKAGERKTVAISVSHMALTAVDEDGRRSVESSRFKVFVGFSQPDDVSVRLRGEKPVELLLCFNDEKAGPEAMETGRMEELCQ